jgi:hypothetical protein
MAASLIAHVTLLCVLVAAAAGITEYFEISSGQCVVRLCWTQS